MTKISGVYKITNKITGEFYIGSSKDVKERWHGHRNISNWKRFPNVKLYQAMAQYGRDNFTFEVVEETRNLKEREQYWIEQFKPIYNDRRANGLNIERQKTYKKEYNHSDNGKEAKRKSNKKYWNQNCYYMGETLTLSALKGRFQRAGIECPLQEAKKFIIREENK